MSIFTKAFWTNNYNNTNKNAHPFTITPEETMAQRRIMDNSLDRLIFGPGKTFVATCSCVFAVGAMEGWLHLAPSSKKGASLFEKAHFVTRYALANIIPSMVWDRIKAETIIKSLNMNPKIIGNESKRLSWRRKKLQSLRGSLAGTVFLSQLVSLLNVSMKAKQDYSKRLFLGKEPPFNLQSQKEVVIRLAGTNSDVTSLSLERWGRRTIFPIYEKDTQEIRHLVQKHGFDDPHSEFGVPIFWRVENGRYGDPESWKGMTIPKTWLLSAGDKHVLLLEADALGKGSVESIFSPDMATHSDLDLYEATQGFYQLKHLVEKDAPPFDTLRVLLVDSNNIVTSGGGRQRTVRTHVDSLELADIIIDAREPLLSCIKDWLQHRSWDPLHARCRRAKGKRPVIVETPSATFFQALKTALGPFGYSVMDLADAKQEYGSIQDIPVLVNEDTSLATIQTVRSLLERQFVSSSNICAFCGDQCGLVELENDEQSSIVTICSSDVYDGLFRLVREMAVQGYSKSEIQERLDNYVCKSVGRGGRQLGFPSS